MALDPGVHIYDACRTTGKIIKKVVEKVTISLSVQWSLKSTDKKYARWRLVLYSNTDMHPLLLEVVPLGDEVPASAHTETHAPMHVKKEGATTVFMRLYAEVFSKEDGVYAQELVASGCAHRDSPHGVRLLDIEKQTVAIVDVDDFPFDSDAPAPPQEHRRNEAAQDLIRAVEKAQMRLPKFIRSTDNFTSVQVHLDRVTALPLVWFAFHATRMRVADPAQATAYFENLLFVATKLQMRNSSPYQLLADMLALPSLAWVYRDDTDSLGKESEHWVSLWSYPPGATNAFDCEDGAKALLELFYVFTRIELTNEATDDLRRMQKLARGYKAYLAIGELFSEDGSARRNGKSKTGQKRTSDDFVMHCYCILLPNDPTLPTLTLESSSYGSSAFTPGDDSAQLDDQELVRSQQKQLKKFPSKFKASRVLACMRFPPAEMLRDRAYGALVALLISEPDGKTEHYLMNRIDTFDFLLDANRKLPDPVFSLSYKKTEELFAQELALSPGSRFPTPMDTRFRPLHVVERDSVLFPFCASTEWTHTHRRAIINLSTDSSLCVL